jgi:NTP pyrophosphatase (non-canonical NTP hydrolase)
MEQLTMNGYQEAAMKTCMPTCDNFSYMMLNLIGEVGELASKVAKDIRKGNVDIDTGKGYTSELMPNMPFDEWVIRSEEYMAEAGDILWQLSGLCKVMGWTLEDVARGNLAKLASRMQRGVIDGNGDNR